MERGGEAGGIVGEEVAEDDAEGGGVNRFGGGIGVGVGDFDAIAAMKGNAALFREDLDWHREDASGGIERRREGGDGLIRGDVLEDKPLAVIAEEAAGIEELSGIGEIEAPGFRANAGGQIIGRFSAPHDAEPDGVDVFRRGALVR